MRPAHLQDTLVTEHVVLNRSKEFGVHYWGHNALRPDKEAIENLWDKVIHESGDAASHQRTAHGSPEVHAIVDLRRLQQCDDEDAKARDLVNNRPQVYPNSAHKPDI